MGLHAGDFESIVDMDVWLHIPYLSMRRKNGDVFSTWSFLFHPAL